MFDNETSNVKGDKNKRGEKYRASVTHHLSFSCTKHMVRYIVVKYSTNTKVFLLFHWVMS